VGGINHRGKTSGRSWLGGLERETPETRAIVFAPSFEDAVAIRVDDRHSGLGENDLAAEVGERPQTDEGVGEGGHHVPLHCRRRE
jgi:hypothetical protein